MIRISRMILTVALMIFAFSGCKTTSTPIIPDKLSPQEKEVYDTLKNVEAGWVEQDFDKVFASYADDGVFTGKNNAPVSKEELLALCNDTKNDWKITGMEIKKLIVEGNQANAETTIKMVAGGNSINHKENYELEKRDGVWLIVKEINP